MNPSADEIVKRVLKQSIGSHPATKWAEGMLGKIGSSDPIATLRDLHAQIGKILAAVDGDPQAKAALANFSLDKEDSPD